MKVKHCVSRKINLRRVTVALVLVSRENERVLHVKDIVNKKCLKKLLNAHDKPCQQRSIRITCAVISDRRYVARRNVKQQLCRWEDGLLEKSGFTVPIIMGKATVV